MAQEHGMSPKEMSVWIDSVKIPRGHLSTTRKLARSAKSTMATISKSRLVKFDGSRDEVPPGKDGSVEVLLLGLPPQHEVGIFRDDL